MGLQEAVGVAHGRISYLTHESLPKFFNFRTGHILVSPRAMTDRDPRDVESPRDHTCRAFGRLMIE